ncbi:hypothetical protein RF11_00892 [Thelohanellus kitauei]|uniref:Uncharacterized protein n=1 Tax=Thelohanellus kitauei TaxID=669202 RepID=A0A0C2MU98_THEKT|nr:hypothetical protein RF11_00892 [Thelohanellus kitauei]
MELVDINHITWTIIKCSCLDKEDEIEISRCGLSSGMTGQVASNTLKFSYLFTLNKKTDYFLPKYAASICSSNGCIEHFEIKWNSVNINFQNSIRKYNVISKRINILDVNPQTEKPDLGNPFESNNTTYVTNHVNESSTNIMMSSVTTQSSEEPIVTEEPVLIVYTAIKEIPLAHMMASGNREISSKSSGTESSTESETTISTNTGETALSTQSSDQTKQSTQSVTRISTNSGPNNPITQSSMTKITRSASEKKQEHTTVYSEATDSYDLGFTMKKDSWPINDMLLIGFVVVTVSLLFYDIKVRRKISGHLRSSIFRV